ncbi:hypothetical protein CEXT_90021 [Caerostris extrusa]|uniref:Uncharacterized protein n=1 Tax=Caerostris extrusa TaxID=172846 RepID=A0AAV4WTF9_CAEEX|nr:hypothetical protein CEXT_90021 [Caerostris extrusa]
MMLRRRATGNSFSRRFEVENHVEREGVLWVSEQRELCSTSGSSWKTREVESALQICRTEQRIVSEEQKLFPTHPHPYREWRFAKRQHRKSKRRRSPSSRVWSGLVANALDFGIPGRSVSNPGGGMKVCERFGFHVKLQVLVCLAQSVYKMTVERQTKPLRERRKRLTTPARKAMSRRRLQSGSRSMRKCSLTSPLFSPPRRGMTESGFAHLLFNSSVRRIILFL